jgi:hypothetical protein
MGWWQVISLSDIFISPLEDMYDPALPSQNGLKTDGS